MRSLPPTPTRLPHQRKLEMVSIQACHSLDSVSCPDRQPSYPRRGRRGRRLLLGNSAGHPYGRACPRDVPNLVRWLWTSSCRAECPTAGGMWSGGGHEVCSGVHCEQDEGRRRGEDKRQRRAPDGHPHRTDLWPHLLRDVLQHLVRSSDQLLGRSGVRCGRNRAGKPSSLRV